MKPKIAIIGCTVSTNKLINYFQSSTQTDLIGVITLDNSLGTQKVRYFEINPQNINVIYITDINKSFLYDLLQSWNLDILIEVGWSQKIPKNILEIPKYGTIGLHNSLLPAFKGSASLNWALIWDYSEWGCTLFYLEENFDEGDIIAQKTFYINDNDDINSLFLKSDKICIEMMVQFIPLICRELAPRISQDITKSSRTSKRTPEDSKIDWDNSSRNIFNLIRALKIPYPRAFTYFDNQKIFIGNATQIQGAISKPGIITQINAVGYVVCTSKGSLEISEIEFEDGQMCKLKIGDYFHD